MRGASEFEKGASRVCPQGIPISHLANNEAHNNGRYGLRIFTGRSAHNGEGVPGFYPRTADPCAPVSQTVEMAAFVVAQLATPSSHGGKRWLGAAPHTPEGPLRHWACSRWRGCPL